MDYKIEKLSVDNAHEYAYVNSNAWLESYKGIIDDEYLEEINTDESIKTFTEKLKGYVVNDPDHFWERKEAEFLEPESAENFIFTLENYDDIVNAYGLTAKKNIYLIENSTN